MPISKQMSIEVCVKVAPLALAVVVVLLIDYMLVDIASVAVWVFMPQ